MPCAAHGEQAGGVMCARVRRRARRSWQLPGMPYSVRDERAGSMMRAAAQVGEKELSKMRKRAEKEERGARAALAAHQVRPRRSRGGSPCARLAGAQLLRPRLPCCTGARSGAFVSALRHSQQQAACKQGRPLCSVSISFQWSPVGQIYRESCLQGPHAQPACEARGGSAAAPGPAGAGGGGDRGRGASHRAQRGRRRLARRAPGELQRLQRRPGSHRSALAAVGANSLCDV